MVRPVKTDKEADDSENTQTDYWFFWKKKGRKGKKQDLIDDAEWRKLVGMNTTMPEFDLI